MGGVEQTSCKYRDGGGEKGGLDKRSGVIKMTEHEPQTSEKAVNYKAVSASGPQL